MPIDYLSEGTTILSNISLNGSNISAVHVSATTMTATLVGAVAGSSNFSGAAVSGTSATFSGVVSIAGGTPITRMGNTRKVVTTLTAAATKSTETTWADNNVAQGDVIWGSPTSTISEGLAWNFNASAASVVRLRISNVSAAAASMDSGTWNYWHIKP